MALLAAPAMALNEGLPYYCGFENANGHVVGAPPNGWACDAPTSVAVQSDAVYEAQQALSILGGAAADQTFTPTGGVVWVDGYQLGAPSIDLPDIEALTSGSAVVAFSQSLGIVCWAGDGAGSGTWAQTDVVVDPSKWYRVTLKLDYTAKTYDCYVNGALELQGVGFLYDTADTTELHGFHASAGDSVAYLDSFSVSAAPPANIGETAPGPEFVRYYDFIHDEEGWGFESVIVDAASVSGSTTPLDYLSISANADESYGRWYSEFLPAVADSVYELRWAVSTDQASAADSPWFRMRANTADLQVANILNIISLGASNYSPPQNPAERVYQQVFQLPDSGAAQAFEMNFDIVQFLPGHPLGAQLRLNDILVLRHDAADLAGGDLAVEYDFDGTDLGWNFDAPPFLSGGMANIVPTSDTTADAVVLVSASNLGCFGSWISPTNAAEITATPKLFRADFDVSADLSGAGRDACPGLRLRVLANNYESNVELDVKSQGDGGSSPLTMRTYSAFFLAPDGVSLQNQYLGLAFDIINFIPSDQADGQLLLERAAIYSLDLGQ